MKISVMGQVITRVLSPDDQIENYIPWYDAEENIPIVSTPLVDVETVLEEDRRTGREMPRIGIKQDLNIRLDDGQVIKRGNYTIWNMTLYSKNSKSLSIRFDDTYLPDKAIMFLYNKETKFIVGPIHQTDFRNGTYRSDYLNGDHIDITIFIPDINLEEDLTLTINTFDYGIISFRVFDDDFQDSEPCNVNVACEEGNGWECQSESVCKIIHSTIGSCTGSLINNDCCDLTPIILTADHCVAGLPVDDYLYRFNYQSPQCDPNGETSPSQWTTYFGSEIRACWGGTDFGLVELFDRPTSNMSFAGWDRTNQTPPNSTFIHHPSGDVKKITFDNGVSTPAGNFYNFNLTPGTNGDFGTLEGGSSGCPKYNPGQRIIGQQSGGTPHRILCNTTNSDNIDGRLDRSWNGGGAVNSRLQDWLGASTNPNTMDCMAHPFIEGPDLLCDSETFTLVENMPCAKQITWEVSPAYLFNSSTTGFGTSAFLAQQPNQTGRATLTFTLSSEGCNESTVEHEFYVGAGFNFYYDNTLCVRELGHAFLDPLLPPNAISNVVWTFSGAITGSGGSNFAKYRGRRSGYGDICVTYWDGCEIIDKCYGVYVRTCNGGEGPRSLTDVEQISTDQSDTPLVQPNPFYGQFEIYIPKFAKDTEMTHVIRNSNGQIIRRITSKAQSIQVDLSEQPIGIYLIESRNGINIYNQKLIKW